MQSHYTMRNEGKSEKVLWEALEEKRIVPKVKTMQNLSGLMGEERARFSEAWSHLPVEVRREITQTLGEMSEADFEMDFAAIFRIAIKDTDPHVRASAIDGLWEDEDVRLVPHLAQTLRQDEASNVRVAAAQCLAHFVLLGELKKIRPRPFQTAYNALYASYHDRAEELEVRRRALESIAYVSNDDIPPIIREAYAHAEELMRISAVFAMGRSADRRWAKIVVRELNNPNPAMRYEAARACGELRLRQAAPDLVELVEDVDTEIQQVALWSLGQIGGDLARKTLQRYVHDENEALHTAARAALNELEFFHGNLNTFFGPPEDFSGVTDLSWEEDQRDGSRTDW
jgi:HEAT repeat protein